MKKPQKIHTTIEPLEARIAPASLLVTNLRDSGAGSLRAALHDAEAGDVIAFSSALHGILNLSTTLEVTAGVTIKAAAPGAIALSGQNAVQIMSINDGDDDTLSSVKLMNLSFIKGLAEEAGGGILDAENLTTSYCTFFGNHATAGNGGAIAVVGDGATVKLMNSKFAGNTASGDGGAVDFAGTSGSFFATSSIFKNNTATRGGAVAAEGVPTVQFTSSTIASNTASQLGGGVYLEGVARGSFVGSSVADNAVTGTASATGGGGIAIRASDLKLMSTTLNGNTAAISGGGLLVEETATASLQASTVRENVAQWGGGVNFDGDLKLLNSNIADNIAIKDGGGIYGQTGAQNISITGGTISGNQALGSTGGGLDLLNGGYQLIARAKISGNSATVSGGGFTAANGNLSVSGTLFTQNGATLGGGVYLFAGSSTLTAHFNTCTFAGNSVVADGGGIYLAGAAASIKQSAFSANNASSGGGGLYVDATANAIVNGSTFTRNQADQGGGLYFTGQVSVGTSTLSQNIAASNGGAIYGGTSLQDFLIANSTISGNKSLAENGKGGGFCLTGSGKQSIYTCNIIGNKAISNGGGIAASNGVLDVIASVITANSATFGGGASLSKGTVNVSANFTDSTITGNKALTVGGGLYSSTSSAQILVGSKVTGNIAPASADLFGSFLQS